MDIRKYCKTGDIKYIKNNKELIMFSYKIANFVLKGSGKKKYKKKAQRVVDFLENNTDINELDLVYLSLDKRIYYSEQIKDYLPGEKLYGKYCINQQNKKLLKYMKIDKLLGTGSFGNVYRGTTIDERYKFAVKLASIEDEAMEEGIHDNIQSWQELFFLRDIINPLAKEKCPNLPILTDYFTCGKCAFKFLAEDDITFIDEKSSCLILITELANGDLSDWFETKHTKKELGSAMFQIMAGLYTLHTDGKIANNDIKAKNILFYDVKPGGYWEYIIEGRSYYVPNLGKLFIINDFGVSNHQGNIIKYNLNEKRKYIGEYYGMVIGEKISPFKLTSLVDLNTNWYVNGKAAAKTSLKTETYINILDKGMKLNTFIEKLSKKQKKELKKTGLTTDIHSLEFYENIPNFAYINDTIDAINMFNVKITKRTSQPGFHEDHNTNKSFSTLLNKYYSEVVIDSRQHMPEYESGIVLKELKPEKLFTNYFIKNFFTKDFPLTSKPTGKLLTTYTL
jgi:hypothetical protein